MDNQIINRTPLHDIHQDLGAKMIEFGGWHMPVSYQGIISEHKLVREEVGVFDISHMGEFLLEGEDVIDMLQYVMVNDLRLIKPFKSQYSCICYENGTVVDDGIYYEETPKKFRMIVNAANREKDFNWLETHRSKFNVEIKDLSFERSRLAIQGPKVNEYLNPFIDIDSSSLNRFNFQLCNFDEFPIILANTGYTGEKGFELSTNRENIEEIFNRLLEAGVNPIGLGARDTLRLEASYSLYGHEISENITPIEANIGWVVKEKDDVDYIGKEVLLKQKREGTSRILVGLTLIEPGIMRENYNIYKEGNNIGYITSGGYSPTLDKSIGLALIKTEYNTIGNEVDVEIRNKHKKAKIVQTPFYTNL